MGSAAWAEPLTITVTPELRAAEGESHRKLVTLELRVAKVDRTLLWRSQGAAGVSKAAADICSVLDL